MNYPLNFPKDLQPGMVTLLGIPFDKNSSFLRGPALAPAIIRDTLNAGSTNLCAENEIDLGENKRFIDIGDINFINKKKEFDIIEQHIGYLLKKQARVISLGGDHSISYPILRAYNKQYDNINILHLDAHPDLYDELGGNRYSHACPFSRIMEEKLTTRLVQVGIRTMNSHQRKQAVRFGVEVIDMREWQLGAHITFNEPIYLSVDLDVLDPAFAPGVSHHEPGGLSTREVIKLIQGIDVPIIGADIVEFNPKRDVFDMTAMVAAKLVKEIAAKMIENNLKYDIETAVC